MRGNKTTVGLSVMIALAILAVGCAPGRIASGGDEPAPTTGAPATSVPQGDPAAGLDGTQWDVTEIDGAPVTDKGKGTLDFVDGQVGGTAFCNSFGGDYEVEGSTLTLGQLVRTLMACEDMGPETEYFAALAAVTTYRIDAGDLVLSDAEGNDLVVLVPATSASLEDTLWTLTGITAHGGVSSLVFDSEITATLAGGAMSGTAGCNGYSATYTVDGTQLTLGPAIATKMACVDPAGVMEQEAAFLAALSSVAAYHINRTSLTFLDAGGATLLTFAVQGE